MRESFERRIDASYLYAPDGRLDGPAFSIRLPRDPVWEWMQKTVDTIDDEYDELGTRRSQEWCTRFEDGMITQTLRQIASEDALRYLPDGS